MTVTFTFSVSSPAASASTGTETGAQLAGATALRDLKLAADTGDLVLDEGDLVFNYGIEGVASDLASRWKTFKGEYFLNLDMGIDYWGIIFVGKPNLGAIEKEFRREALDTPGIADISLSLSLADRVLSVEAQITTDLGLLFGVTFAADLGA